MSVEANDAVGTNIVVGQKKLFFGLDDGDWVQVTCGPNGEGAGEFPDGIVGNVDLAKFFERGMWTKYYDTGPFNVLELKLAPGFTIPRHHHNSDQLVFVLEGEARQGNRSFQPGDAYMTPAGQTYTVTAGPEGLRYIEIRTAPIEELQTIWDESNPGRWTHAD
jgi:mannose-6-phosphate isomerase-like protein (cupin superfamily)